MPQNFIWVHLDAASRIQTLKADVSRLDRQLVDTAVLDKMHQEVLNPHSELYSTHLTMRTLRGSSRSQQESSSSSFADGMSQVMLDQFFSAATAFPRFLSTELALSILHTRLTKSRSSLIRSSDTPQRSSLIRCQRRALSVNAAVPVAS